MNKSEVSNRSRKGISRIKSGAELGIPYAQWLLGNRYFHGYEVPQDSDLAAFWYSKAADQGTPYAQYHLAVLGRRDLRGDGLTDGVLELLIAAAKGADRQAQMCLGEIFLYGQGIKPDLDQAWKYLKQAEENWMTRATCHVAFLKVTGVPMPQSVNKALDILRPMAVKGSPESYYAYGVLLVYGLGHSESSITEGISWIKKAALVGVPEAQREIGRLIFSMPEILQESHESATPWLFAAATQGDAWAQALLADSIAMGSGTHVDLGAAKQWYLQAEKGGFTGTLCHQGYSLFHCLSPVYRPFEVLLLMERSIELGYSISRDYIADLLIENQDSFPVSDRVITLLSNAAPWGSQRLFNYLSDIYFNRVKSSSNKFFSKEIGMFWLQAAIEPVSTRN